MRLHHRCDTPAQHRRRAEDFDGAFCCHRFSARADNNKAFAAPPPMLLDGLIATFLGPHCRFHTLSPLSPRLHHVHHHCRVSCAFCFILSSVIVFPSASMLCNSEERLVNRPACAPPEPPGPKRPRRALPSSFLERGRATRVARWRAFLFGRCNLHRCASITPHRITALSLLLEPHRRRAPTFLLRRFNNRILSIPSHISKRIPLSRSKSALYS